MLPAICAGPWWWTKLSPPSVSSAAAKTYSCSAVKGCRRRVRCRWLAGLRVSAGDLRQQLHWPPRRGPHGGGRDRGSQRRAVRWPVLPEPRGIWGEVPAGRRPGHCSAVCAVRFGPIRAVASPLLYHGGTVVVVSSGGPCCSASGPSPGGRAGGAGCGKLCAPRRSGCVWYGFCRRCSGAARGRKSSWCGYQWPCAVDGLQSISHCSTTPPGCAASTRRCKPRRPWRLDVPAGGMWVCG